MTPNTALSRMRGFSLIETMIGLLIGMVSVVIVLQVYARSDSAKRVSNSTDDAQMNALLAMHTLEREVRQAGLGLSAFTILGCKLGYTSVSDGGTAQLTALAPVTINPDATVVPAGDAGTDTLLILSGNSDGPSEGDPTVADASTQALILATSTSGYFTAGERVIAALSTRPASCTLKLDTVRSVSATTLTLAQGTAFALPNDSLVYNLGATPRLRAYAVRNGNLTVCDYLKHNCGDSRYTSTLDSTVWVPVVSQIVGLRAQYARDTSGISGSSSTMTGVVGTYDQLTPGSTADASTIPVYCKWVRIVGLRLAVVGRANHPDRSAPTTSSTLNWSGSSDAPVSVSRLTNWAQYRYRLLESAAPLRNIIWQGEQTTYQGGAGGC